MTPSPDADRELFTRFRNGDADAFDGLVERHRRALEACVRQRLDRRIQKRVSVADVVQDARIVAFERCAEFHGDGHDALRKWLLGIVTNRARKAIERHAGADKRAVEHEVTRSKRPSTVMLRGAGGTPSEALAAKEFAALAVQARTILSKEEAELLRLVHDEGLTLRQAAERLGRSHDAVRKQHARTLRRLGRAFRRLRGESSDAIRRR